MHPSKPPFQSGDAASPGVFPQVVPTVGARMKGRLEVAANIAVLVAVAVFLTFFGRQEYDRRHHSAAPPASAVGQTISLPGVHFAPQSKTLVLAISTTCHFCKESEPFYRRLVSGDSGQVKMIAVLPQSQAAAQSYVQSSIAPSVQVVSSGLETIGVRGTPTVLLLDGSGKVEKVWVGKLSDQGEKEVLSLVM